MSFTAQARRAALKAAATLSILAFTMTACDQQTSSSQSSAAPAASATAPAVTPAPATPAAATQPKPDQVGWDLADLYPSGAAWTEERNATDKLLDQIATYKGTLGQSSGQLLKALEDISSGYKRVMRLYVYAQLLSDEDLRIAENRERKDLAEQIYVKIGEATSWLSPEVLAIGAEKIAAFQAEQPKLKEVFGFQLDNILRGAPHTLGDEAEAVIAAAGNVLRQAEGVYSVYADAEMKFPTVKLSDGSEVTIDQANYTRYRQARDRADRKLVFDSFWKTWKDYEGTFGANLSAHVAGHVFLARARKFPNALAAALFGDNMPEAVYRQLITQANAGLPTLHRYFRLRKRMLGITDDMAYYDIYPSMVSYEKPFSLEDSKRLTLASLKPYGEEYTKILETGFSGKWMHVYPQDGKASGAYMFGSAYDVHPYLLLNHNDDYDSLSTFAHEWGHAVHTVLADRAQPWETSDYPTFVAETASIMNEMLLQDYMVKQAQSRDEKLYYLGEALEAMRGTFFRQTMFAEFELAIHEAAEKGEALSGAKMSEIYCDLLKRYHGADQGVMTIDPTYCIEWAFIPHFYRNFYVYSYATSITGAAYFAEKVVTGGEAERENFLAMLRAGGSDYGYNIYLKAGLDMTKPEPYQAAVRRMDRIMDDIEALLAQPN